MLSYPRCGLRHVSTPLLRARAPSRWYHDSQGRVIDPLRILYCGSDEFSLESLKRLTEQHKQDPSFINSIDVVFKTSRPHGRGLKLVYESPVGAFAREAGLGVHPIKTFTGWWPPRYNLIIAVSFGLFVPPRILRKSKHGSLNIHPSLLPQLRGPAPLHHTLIHNVKNTGITLCTLDPRRFDHGSVIRQEKLEVPEGSMKGYESLRDFLAPKGAELLVDSLRQGLFRDPTFVDFKALPPASHAPKLTDADGRINWSQWSSDRIFSAQKVNRTLWNQWPLKDGTTSKVNMFGMKIVGNIAATQKEGISWEAGVPRRYTILENGEWLDRTPSPGDKNRREAYVTEPAHRKATKGDVLIMDKVEEGLIPEPDDAGRRQIVGMFSTDGAFLTMDRMIVQRKGKSTTVPLSVGIQMLYDLAGTPNQTLC